MFHHLVSVALFLTLLGISAAQSTTAGTFVSSARTPFSFIHGAQTVLGDYVVNHVSFSETNGVLGVTDYSINVRTEQPMAERTLTPSNSQVSMSSSTTSVTFFVSHSLSGSCRMEFTYTGRTGPSGVTTLPLSQWTSLDSVIIVHKTWCNGFTQRNAYSGPHLESPVKRLSSTVRTPFTFIHGVQTVLGDYIVNHATFTESPRGLEVTDYSINVRTEQPMAERTLTPSNSQVTMSSSTTAVTFFVAHSLSGSCRMEFAYTGRTGSSGVTTLPLIQWTSLDSVIIIHKTWCNGFTQRNAYSGPHLTQ